MTLGSEPKRLLIYSFCDKKGIVDRYVLAVMKDLKRNVSRTVFACNCKLAEGQAEKLDGISDAILECKYECLDMFTYKQVLEKIGYDSLAEYDEVILMDSSIMGPVNSTDKMFSDMDAADVDFWGLSKRYIAKSDVSGPEDENDDISEYMESHFLAIRKPIFAAGALKKFWECAPDISRDNISGTICETEFTDYFNKLGFRSEVYVKTDGIAEYSDYPMMFIPDLLVKEYDCPYFKRDVFCHDYGDTIVNTVGQAAHELMKYLKTSTDYDTDMIWENILRCCNMSDIKNALALNYVLPSDKYIGDNHDRKKIALVFHAYFPDLIEETARYVGSMPDYADIYITTNTKEKADLFRERFKDNKFNKLEVIEIENRGRDVSSLLVATKSFIMDYDFVCFAHDKKVGQIAKRTVGQGFAYQCLENVLASESYIMNVVDLFEKNPRLGLLTPPPPVHECYFWTIGSNWGPNFDIVRALAEKLELDVPINEEHEPIAPLGTMFWFRPCGMKKLFDCDWEYSDFPREPNGFDGTILHAIERIYGFVEQDAGYYCAWGMADYSSGMYLSSVNYMLRGYVTNSSENEIYGIYTDAIVRERKVLEMRLGLSKVVSAFLGSLPPDLQGMELREKTRLYFDAGNGLNEDDVIIKSERCDGRMMNDCFRLPRPATTIRFDPTESKIIMVKDLVISVEYKSGRRKELDLADCYANGRRFGKNNYIFVDGDPQIQYTSKTGKIVSVFVSCSMNTYVDMDECAEIVKWCDPDWSFGHVSFIKKVWHKVKDILRPIKKVLVRKRG